MIKRDWIERTKLHKDSLDEDEMLIQEFIKPKGGEQIMTKTASSLGSKTKGKGGSKASATRDLEARFEQLLNLDLIDVPDDFYEDEILYDQPEQLLERFTALEDANLKNVLDT